MALFRTMQKVCASHPLMYKCLSRSGTDRGNNYKIEKRLDAYDEDATLSIDLLSSLENCNGRIAGE